MSDLSKSLLRYSNGELTEDETIVMIEQLTERGIVQKMSGPLGDSIRKYSTK